MTTPDLSVEDVPREDEEQADPSDLLFEEPDNPLVEGPREYSVRLAFRVNAHDWEHARTRFIAVLNQYGMNSWGYRVVDIETEQERIVQDGVVLTVEEFTEAVGDDDADGGS